MAQDSRLVLSETPEGDLVFHGLIRAIDVTRAVPNERELQAMRNAGEGSPVSVKLRALAAIAQAIERTPYNSV